MITHKGTQELRTERLVLRRFTLDDAEAMFNNWANDARVARYLTWTPHTSPDNSRQLLTAWCAAYENLNCYNWAIEFEGQPIGNISVVRQSDHSERADLGYCMGFDFWGKGIMTEAVTAVRDYLFKEIGFNRLEIAHATKNPGSGRVAEKCGFTPEGTKRQYYKSHTGEFLDCAFLGILKSDWEAAR